MAEATELLVFSDGSDYYVIPKAAVEMGKVPEAKEDGLTDILSGEMKTGGFATKVDSTLKMEGVLRINADAGADAAAKAQKLMDKANSAVNSRS